MSLTPAVVSDSIMFAYPVKNGLIQGVGSGTYIKKIRYTYLIYKFLSPATCTFPSSSSRVCNFSFFYTTSYISVFNTNAET